MGDRRARPVARVDRIGQVKQAGRFAVAGLGLLVNPRGVPAEASEKYVAG